MPNILVPSPLTGPPTVLNQPEVAGSIFLQPATLGNPPTFLQNPAFQGSVLELAPMFGIGPVFINQPTFIAGVSVVVAAPVSTNPATTILAPTVATSRVIQAPVLGNPSTTIKTPVVRFDTVQHPSALSNPSTTIQTPASITLGVIVHPATLSNPATTIRTPASITGGVTLHPAVLSNPATVLDVPAADTSVTTHPSVLTNPSTTILSPAAIIRDVVVKVPQLNNQWAGNQPAAQILAATVNSGVIFPVLAPLAGLPTVINQPTLDGTGTSVPALTLVCGATVLQEAVWSSVDPYVEWPLELRQQRLYLERVNVWRKKHNSVNDPVWYLLIGNLPCKMFTSPNRDRLEAVFQAKTPGVFLFNRLGTVAGADIRFGDCVEFLGPNQPDSVPLAWYLVEGQPEVKAAQGLRRANQQEVYLQPVPDPPMLGVA